PKPLIAMTNVIMVMTRTEIEGKPARRASVTSEVLGLNSKTKSILTEDVFRWNPKEDKFVFSGHSSILEKHMKKMDISEEEIRRELQRRKTVLEWMVKKGIRRHIDVSNVIREYYANPNRVFQKARVGLK
ncbi:MAG: type IV secretory pathway protein, partial [Candidatus Bathyarchaeota archaeon]